MQCTFLVFTNTTILGRLQITMSREESESITKTLYKIYDSHINKTVAKTIIYIAQKEN